MTDQKLGFQCTHISNAEELCLLLAHCSTNILRVYEKPLETQISVS
jgi:hypothetical protein